MAKASNKIEQRRSLADIRRNVEVTSGQRLKGSDLSKYLKEQGWRQSEDEPDLYVRTVSKD